MNTIEHFGTYIQDLTEKVNRIRSVQEEEKRSLAKVANDLKSAPGFNKMVIKKLFSYEAIFLNVFIKEI